jgi:hypothetical protein
MLLLLMLIVFSPIFITTMSLQQAKAQQQSVSIIKDKIVNIPAGMVYYITIPVPQNITTLDNSMFWPIISRIFSWRSSLKYVKTDPNFAQIFEISNARSSWL